MNQKVYVGIDLAKDSSRVAVVDKDCSKLSNPFSIKNTRDDMEKLAQPFHVLWLNNCPIKITWTP